ncbi:hypothetical protein TUM4644_33350 [Shewanella colwelliana]|uniref:hypothetical protein n=1 Tax=Shewanella colwelliana TaxID=23 RepID=UPI001BC54F8E|nr:hypothetical protein [Shewanella colwelliana]GIU32923.1 hypothetical protein TUM4644_33350 [Shewanella colwelliana]
METFNNLVVSLPEHKTATIEIKLDFDTKEQMKTAYCWMRLLAKMKATGLQFKGGLRSTLELERQFEHFMPEFKEEFDRAMQDNENLKYLLEQNFSTSLA